jgi:hypothetical protein
MGVAPFAAELLKEILCGEYFRRDRALTGECLAAIGSAEIDLALEAPFPISRLEFNEQLEWNFRWLNLHHEDIWVVQGQAG